MGADPSALSLSKAGLPFYTLPLEGEGKGEGEMYHLPSNSLPQGREDWVLSDRGVITYSSPRTYYQGHTYISAYTNCHCERSEAISSLTNTSPRLLRC